MCDLLRKVVGRILFLLVVYVSVWLTSLIVGLTSFPADRMNVYVRRKTGMLASSSIFPLVYGGNRSVTGIQVRTLTVTPNIFIFTQHFPLQLQKMPFLMWNSFFLSVGRRARG